MTTFKLVQPNRKKRCLWDTKIAIYKNKHNVIIRIGELGVAEQEEKENEGFYQVTSKIRGYLGPKCIMVKICHVFT